MRPMTTSPAAAGGTLAALNGPGLLRTALLLDAAVTGLNGAAYLAGASSLDGLLGLNAGLLRGIGAFLLAYGIGIGIGVAVLGRRQRIPRPAAWAVVGINAVWAVDSLAAAAMGWGTPSTAGRVWIVAQAFVVGGFAALQALGLRRQS